MFKVLVYHKIENTENFEKQIVFLKKHYTLISSRDLTNFKQITYPNKKPPLLITFDDGDISFYENAYPLLKKHEIPAVIFIITGLIGSREPFWWDSIAYYNPEKKNPYALVWEVKNWPNKKRMRFIEELKRNSEKEEFFYPQLNWEQLLEMKEAGIDIANHSHSHPMFDHCSPAEIESEIQSSISALKNFNFMFDVFAYPNGNFSLQSEKLIKKAGIKFAFLFDHKINRTLEDPLRISRLMVEDSTPLWKFRFILSGLHSKLLPFRKKLYKYKF